MIACLIQTRMKSTRLPGKCMMKINGIPMVEYVIKAAKKSKLINRTGIIYPNTKEDEIFLDIYLSKCFCFSGSENNVLDRYYKAIKAMKYIEKLYFQNISNIIRLTSDCPLLFYHYKLIDKVIKFHIDNKFDFTHNRDKNGYPSGLDIEIMTRKTLEKCWEEAESKEEKEHVTLYIKNNRDKFKIGEYNLPENIKINSKMSVDTQEDFDKISDIINLYKLGENYDRNEK